MGIYKALPEHVRAANQRRNMDFDLDKSYPWGFFDGAAQNDLCGGGAYLYLSESHYFSLSMGLGVGTNNFAEIMSLKFLLIFVVEKGIKRLTVLGDSMNVINWTNQTQTIQAVIQTLDIFSCRHVYRENNQKADQASKEGLLLELGTWKINEERDGQSFAYYHRPFMD